MANSTRSGVEGCEARKSGRLFHHQRCGLVGRVLRHGGEEAGSGEGVVAGTADGLDAHRIRLELLLAREARERALARSERQLPLVAEHIGDSAADDHRVPRLVLALDGVVGDDVRHLVGEDRRDLGEIVGERDEPARDVKIAAGEREGVHHRRVEDGDAVTLVGPLGGGNDPPDNSRHRLLELVVVVDAAISGDDPCMFFGARAGRRRNRLGTRADASIRRHASSHQLVAASASASPASIAIAILRRLTQSCTTLPPRSGKRHYTVKIYRREWIGDPDGRATAVLDDATHAHCPPLQAVDRNSGI